MLPDWNAVPGGGALGHAEEQLVCLLVIVPTILIGFTLKTLSFL